MSEPSGGGTGPAAPAQRLCRECGTPVADRYCPYCGQATAVHTPSVWEFLHEIVSHYVAAEGKLWRTLATLVRQPGRLTTEYLAGRRQRYIIPLRLYLTVSFVFFAMAQWSASTDPSSRGVVLIRVSPGPEAPLKTVKVPVASSDASEKRELEQAWEKDYARCVVPGNDCSLLRRLAAPAVGKLARDPEHVVERFSERFGHSLSYSMFLLLPIFASLLWLVYRDLRMFYGEHLVFALHVHSFWFLLALVSLALPESLTLIVTPLYLAYGLWALHRVYGGRWIATFLRGLVVSVVYLLAMGAGAAALSIYLLST